MIWCPNTFPLLSDWLYFGVWETRYPIGLPSDLRIYLIGQGTLGTGGLCCQGAVCDGGTLREPLRFSVGGVSSPTAGFFFGGSRLPGVVIAILSGDWEQDCTACLYRMHA